MSCKSIPSGLAFAWLIAGPGFAIAQDPQTEGADSTPVASAGRLQGAITLDGKLDEPAWASATPVTSFIQLDPEEGVPGSERTEVRIAYDASALYVGALMRDSAPTSTRLARRDAFLSDSDLFTVALDSYHDHLTAFRFSVNPSGVRRDEVISGSSGDGSSRFGGGDLTWDPVWAAASAVTDSGWVAEMRIPFSQLRFSPADVQTWGLQLERRIARRQELALFAFTPKDERGGVARYGHLTGLQGLRASDRLEVMPYLSARADYRQVPHSTRVDFPNPYRSGSDYGSGLGGDLKYRVSSNFTLDATLNPDFGQVELDPAVVNLTAFETRFEEKRPFFVEGASIFRFGSSGGRGGPGGGSAQLLYSRRIGRAPQLGTPGEAVYSDMPDATTILGAAKLTGRTANGWSIGILEAVTQQEIASFVDISGDRHTTEVEPLGNYFAGRVKRDFNRGLTTIGALATSVNRRLDANNPQSRVRDGAYSGGIDFRHDWANRAWSLNGYFSPSYITGTSRVISAAQRSSARYFLRPDATHLEYDSTATALGGYAASLNVGKRAGKVTGDIAVDAVSPGYEVNDLGFQTAGDRIALNTNFGYEERRPGKTFRQWSLRSGPDVTWNYGGDMVERRIGLFADAELLNYWAGGLRLFNSGGTLNDRLTRGGPLTREPMSYFVGADLRSDQRRKLTVFGGFNTGWDEAGGSRHSADFNIGIKPAETWDIRIGPEFSVNHAVAQYVTSIANAAATETFGRRYIFSDLRQTTLGLETRLNVTFTPALSLEMYAQPFVSSGDFETFKELTAARTFDFTRFGVDAGTSTRTADGRYDIDPDGAGPATPFRLDDRDFSLRSLRGNAVLRWEYRPGSTLFVVWQQTRSAQLSALGLSDPSRDGVGSFDIGRDALGLFDIRPDNILMLKVSYWLNP